MKVYTTAKADLVSPKDAFALLGEPEATAKWDVPPKMIGDVLALSGDSVDNIPGVPGLGRKTASALIKEFGGLDNLLAKIDNVKSDKMRVKLTAAREQIEQNRKMVGRRAERTRGGHWRRSLCALQDGRRAGPPRGGKVVPWRRERSRTALLCSS